MEKIEIKRLLRESLDELFSIDEAGKKKKGKSKEKKEKESSKSRNTGGKKDYSDVKRAFEKIGGPSMVDVMILTGTEDDEKGVNRSLFRKKVKQIKNKDTGSYYQFDDNELTRVRSALDVTK